MAAILDFLMFISQPFEELQGWNLKFDIITPQSLTRTYFEIKLGEFGLADYAIAAILECSYLSHLKRNKAEIWIFSWLPLNLL